MKAEGGSLDPVRLRRNLLSSMPLCFNLFGSLRAEPAFLTLFQRVFDPAATRIVDVICEYAPQPPKDYLDDRTAFDAVVFYETSTGPRFMGIETKYTEPFSAKEYESSAYTAVTTDSGWFQDPETAIRRPERQQVQSTLAQLDARCVAGGSRNARARVGRRSGA